MSCSKQNQRNKSKTSETKARQAVKRKQNQRNESKTGSVTKARPAVKRKEDQQ
jgi:hypothetical protein